LPTLDVEAEYISGEAVPAETWIDLPSHIVRLAFTPLFQQKARELYPSLVKSEFSQLQYSAFLDMILETPDGAVLWHCSQGKDRTGIGAALILGALGADRQTIVDDFDRSNDSYRPLVERFCAEVGAQGGGEDEKDVVRAFMGVSTRNFCRTLDFIDSQWGSLEAYLLGPLGLDRNDLALLRGRYLE
ncbi:MAG: tyrosine-protein phosphatase, partial [Bacteroidales bacterium]|nr:tyrosine-protein phosphatase [Bacteroidales bacterium]